MASVELGSRPCHCRLAGHKTRFVAITGGPGGGKTAVLEMARRSFCGHVGILPEAASVVFGGGFPRHESDPGRRSAQRAIFYIQREMETLVAEEGQVAIALCDRGTVDGTAYWPGDSEDLWQEVSSSHTRELARYSAVIHLETPDLSQGYNHENELRIESAQEAKTLDRRIREAWSEHPHRVTVSSEAEFADKALEALRVIRAELPPCCHEHILETDRQ